MCSRAYGVYLFVPHFRFPTALRACDDRSWVNDFIEEKAATEAAADAAVYCAVADANEAVAVVAEFPELFAAP